MKKILSLFAILFLSSCLTSTSVQKAERAPKDDKALQLIQDCIRKQGMEAVSCRFEMAEEYAKTYSADPAIVDSKVLSSGRDWQQVQYTIQAEKLRYYIIVKEPKTDIITQITTNATFILVGVLLGYAIKLTKFAIILGL